MKFFTNRVINPYILESGYRSLCEIGAQYGNNTDEFLKLAPLVIDIIDPCLDADLGKKYQGNNRVQVHQGLSLVVLPKISGQFDCILIDGDHNWYTVYNELKTIEKRGLLKPEGTIFLHDVCWPYGRRDMYYQPESIPKEFRNPCKQQALIRGQSELHDSTDHSETFSAVDEGGERNGVLTAIEDFLKEHSDKYKFFYFEEEHGLGVLSKTTSTISNRVFHKHLARAKYRSGVLKLKDLARHKFPALYSSLGELRGKVLKKLNKR
jgi:hypothetical protein